MNANKPSVKILICYHKPDVLLKDDVFTPIHVGRAGARARMGEDNPNFKWLCENMIGDDTGDNISLKNGSYNEITALYWAWKNYDALGNPDYIGLMHYRRHFIFRKSAEVVETVYDMDKDYFERLNYNEGTIEHLFDDCDYVAHIGRVDNVYKHYRENHHVEDLDLAISILKNKYPEFSKTADKYLNMSYCNLCNMFILPKKEFFEYCEWLFSILFEFESRVDLTDKRLFISERLTGIFMEHLKLRGLRQKPLSVTFVRSPMRVSVALPFRKNELFATAVTMRSILMNKKHDVSIDFTILASDENECKRAECLKSVCDEFDGTTLEIKNVPEALKELSLDAGDYDLPRQYPLVLPEIMQGKNKVIYTDNRAIFVKDISDFFITCNNDEFDALTLPFDEKASGERAVYSINTARLRKYKFAQRVAKDCKGKSVREVFKAHAKSGINVFAWWIYGISTVERDGELRYKDLSREEMKRTALARALLYFDEELLPFTSIQGVFSPLWWDVASLIPAGVKFDLTAKDVRAIMHKQNVDLYDYVKKNPPKAQKPESITKLRIRKFKRYYKEHGLIKTLKHTVRKAMDKLARH